MLENAFVRPLTVWVGELIINHGFDKIVELDVVDDFLRFAVSKIQQKLNVLMVQRVLRLQLANDFGANLLPVLQLIDKRTIQEFFRRETREFRTVGILRTRLLRLNWLFERRHFLVDSPKTKFFNSTVLRIDEWLPIFGSRDRGGIMTIVRILGIVELANDQSRENLQSFVIQNQECEVIANILGNAVRHSPDGGTVAVVFDDEAQRVTLTVADQGPGISTADQARIFERYEQTGSPELAAQGTGLGLAISRRLARAMGGDISLVSAPGEGARFTLALDRA